jgi:exonuclease SbcD
LFERTTFDTLIIPGNHDAKAFAQGFYFGERVHLLTHSKWSQNIFDLESTRFIGIPFEELDTLTFRTKLRELRDVLHPDSTNILLYHGELLDASFDRKDFGPGEAARYMPTRLAFFGELPVNYVLAGHFHTNYDLRSIGEGRYFIYPGSPVSITKREIGKRNATIFECGDEPQPLPLETFFYEQVEITLNAFMDEQPLEIVKQRLKGLDRESMILLKMNGTIKGSEKKFVESITDLVKSMKIETEFSFKDISKIVSNPVYTLFERKLAEKKTSDEGGIDETEADRLREIIIRAMVGADL